MADKDNTNVHMNYDELMDYINSLGSFSPPEIHAMTGDFYDFLGRPGESKKIVHVAGTNGKGSVCRYINDILMAHNKSCGLFTSPHLVKLNERIKINGSDVSDEDITKAGNYIISRAGVFNSCYKMNYFEFLFMMAMCIYDKTDLEYLILETGLGGRDDTTNLIKKPVLTIITHIDLDHTKVLGDTIEQIAAEKAGIVKKNVPLVYMDDNPKASEVISKKAVEMNAKAYRINGDNYHIAQIDRKTIDFCFTYLYYKFVVKLHTIAQYQVPNASMAIMGSILLLGDELDEKMLLDSLYASKWEGRMEEIAPNFYVDGAHNPNGIAVWVQSVRDMGKLTLIMSVSRDKDVEGMIKKMTELSNIGRIIVTEYEGGRAMKAAELKALLESNGYEDIVVGTDVADAVKKGREAADGGILFAVGSLYLIGEIKQLMEACND